MTKTVLKFLLAMPINTLTRRNAGFMFDAVARERSTGSTLETGDAMREQSLASAIASTMVAIENCCKSGNAEWEAKHSEHLSSLVASFLPSGSGWDCGTALDRDASLPSKLVFYGSFHHMDEQGYYDGWTEHRITVRPAFNGLDVSVSGKDRNGVKDMLVEDFDLALSKVQDWHVATSAYDAQVSK